MTSSSQPLATQLQDEIEYGQKGMFRKVLTKDKNRQAMLVCLRAGIHIVEHTSAYNSFITVIQGNGTFRLAGREVILEPGVFIDLPAHTLHGLHASENLAMLKVVETYEAMELSPQASRQGSATLRSNCAESLAELLIPYLQGSSIEQFSLSQPCQSEEEC